MAANFRMAGESALGAMRSFSPRSYAPLLLLLLVQLAYLVLGLNLGSTLGMATAGAVARWIVGPEGTEYPAFLQFLPLTFSYIESVTFVVIGAWALPRVAAAILASRDQALADRDRRRARTSQAVYPTFIALAAAFALMYLWQQIVPTVARPALGLLFRGGAQATATWAVSVGVGYAITTLVAYVPIVAVAGGLGTMAALRKGVAAGLERFWFTFPLAILFSLPALLLQLVVQVSGSSIAMRTRPENIVYLLFAYAVLGSVGTYLLWSMATRLHKASEVAR